MFKKIVATLVLVVGVALFGALPASADTSGQATLNPGERYCAREYYPAYSFARGQGQVLSGHNVRWTFGAYGQPKLVDTETPQPSFYAQADRYTQPHAFPGYFQVCAINQSLKVSTVFVAVSSY